MLGVLLILLGSWIRRLLHTPFCLRHRRFHASGINIPIMRWHLVKRSTFFGLEKSQFSLVVAEALHDALSDAPNGRDRQKGGGLQNRSVQFSSVYGMMH